MEINCTMCGHTYDPSAHTACRQCPLQKNCQLVCCPVCGFETVDPQQSKMAMAVKQLLVWTKNRSKTSTRRTSS